MRGLLVAGWLAQIACGRVGFELDVASVAPDADPFAPDADPFAPDASFVVLDASTASPCSPPCGLGQHCETPTGDCSGTGTCVDHPIVQKCLDVYDPVCSCEGTTYSNLCYAAGAAIAYDGECAPSS